MNFTKGILLVGVLSSTIAFARMSPPEVVKQFKEPGHIPQKLKPKMYHPIEEVIPYDQWEQKHQKKKKKKKQEQRARPPQVILWDHDTPVASQWDGTCTTFGLSAAMENLLGQTGVSAKLSTRYMWNQYKEYSVYSAIDAVTKNSQLEAKHWPQSASKPPVALKTLKAKADVQLVKATFLDDDTDSVLDALAEKKPVYVGMAVPSDMAACRSTIRSTSSITDGGHAMAVVGYVMNPAVSGGAYLILKNSWGEDCGDEGYQYFPVGLCEKEDMYCVFWSIDSVKKG